MKPGEAEEKIKELAEPALALTGLALVEVELTRLGKRLLVRVVVDKAGGVGVEDCAQLNRYLSDILDVNDFFAEAYILEVSSPGLDRPLKKPADFAWAVGREVRIVTHRPVEGRNVLEGRLTAFDGQDLTLALAEGEVTLPVTEVARAKLDVDPFQRG